MDGFHQPSTSKERHGVIGSPWKKSISTVGKKSGVNACNKKVGRSSAMISKPAVITLDSDDDNRSRDSAVYSAASAGHSEGLADGSVIQEAVAVHHSIVAGATTQSTSAAIQDSTVKGPNIPTTSLDCQGSIFWYGLFTMLSMMLLFTLPYTCVLPFTCALPFTSGLSFTLPFTWMLHVTLSVLSMTVTPYQYSNLCLTLCL